MGRTILILFLSMMGVLLPRKAGAQISPGPLAQAHAHLEGMANCTRCHSLGNKVTNEKCLACHTPIRDRVSRNKGYHAGAEVKGKMCYTCHNDHHGRNFQIIRFDTESFDHRKTGYPLEGKHSGADCRSCHQQKYISDPSLKKLKNTFLGLPVSCSSCHEDVHLGHLGKECQECHTPEQFSPAARFDHQQSAFPLKGKHRQVKCEACHKRSLKNDKAFTLYRGLKYQRCADCHQDPHGGRFGQDCRQCHSEESFTLVKGQGSFDHSRTRFPLEGRHERVRCADCHKGKLTDPLAFARCTDCHKDYHQGDFVSEGAVTDCRECHSVQGFAGSSFSIERHQTGPFPLKGAHLATPCLACHKRGESWKFRAVGQGCRDCHEDFHAGKIDARYYPEQDCQSCHSENSWREISFSHSVTRFPLEGKHAEASCRQCHFRPGLGGVPVQTFQGLSAVCENCHPDAHYAQFKVQDLTDCSRCHEPLDWLARRFDHDRTRFPLEGRHLEVTCDKCHPRITLGAISYVRYKYEDVRCENCH
ncbi:MAG TPA: cytochrome c3 family protein [Bacteroidales bacterium]|nr:cytochrome c3 family protein [Bacteroidales bacterium]